MIDEISILILEDVAADVVRINHELRQAGLNFRSKRVDTRKDFLHELQHSPPDLILSDHGLPSFDGFAALAIARDKCPRVPFIFVTGALGEQMAIETFKSGATDYVLKERLGDLAPAVERALRTAKEHNKRHESDTDLRKNEERFQMVMEGIKDYAIFMLDWEGRVTFWNAGAQWIHGYAVEEVKGSNFSMFYTEEEITKGKPQLALETANIEGRFEEEGPRLRKGGRQFTANVVLTTSRDTKGDLRGYTVVTRDISARRQAEEKLRRSEALKTAILNTVLDAIISIDHVGLIQEWNTAAQKIFGYRREEVLGRSVDGLIIPESLLKIYHDGVANYLVHGASSLLGKPVELTLRRNDGSEFQAEMAISRVPTEEPPRCTALIRDITERKRTEAALRESEERCRMLVESVKGCAIYLLDPDGRLATWNTGAGRIVGYNAEEIIGKPFTLIFTAEDVERNLPAQLLKQAEKDGQVVYKGKQVRKNGQQFHTESIITALRNETGRLHGFSEVIRDVTEQKEAEEKIHRLNEQLEQRIVNCTAQLKELEAFTVSVSHDLRSPLLYIGSYVEILQNEAAASLSAEHKISIQRIAEGVNRMSDLIEALLSFSRVKHEKLRQERMSVSRMVEEVRLELRWEMEGRNIEWAVGELPEIYGDPLMLKQVFLNLISNALKFTRPRKVAKIEISTQTEGGQTIFFIRDNGVGFDMKNADRLFDVFHRLHQSHEFDGTGIGLANAQRIVLRHGGRIWADSAVDKGTTFYFFIPHHPMEASI